MALSKIPPQPTWSDYLRRLADAKERKEVLILSDGIKPILVITHTTHNGDIVEVPKVGRFIAGEDLNPGTLVEVGSDRKLYHAGSKR